MKGFISRLLICIGVVLGGVACQQWTLQPMPSYIAEEAGALRVTLSQVQNFYYYGDSFYRSQVSVAFTRPVLGLQPEMFELSECLAESVIGNSKAYTLTIRCDDLAQEPLIYLPQSLLVSISGYMNLRSNDLLISGPTY